MSALIEKQTVIPEASLKEQLIADILMLSMKTHYHTECCIFVEFHGHVNALNLSVRESEDNYQNKLAEMNIQLKPYDFFSDKEKEAFEQDVNGKLKETKSYLEHAIESGTFHPEDFALITTRVI